MRDGLGTGRWRRVGVALAAFAAVGAAPAEDTNLLPLAIFGIVVCCGVPLLLACYTLRRRSRVEVDNGMQRVPPRAPAPVRLPVDLTAVHERAPTGRTSGGATETGPETGIRADLQPAQPASPAPAAPERPRSIPPLGGAARCSKCRWVILAGGTPKLWCPNCGADLKLVFDEAKPEAPDPRQD